MISPGAPASIPLLRPSAQIAMSQDEFVAFRAFIYDRTGIYFQDNKKYLLEGRLGKRLQALNLNNFTQYLNLLKNGASKADEMRLFYDIITINETFFFRNEPQFAALEEKLIPDIIAKKGQRSKIRIWSAASSSGEEAHTIGMIYLEKLKPKYPGLELEVVGTDINSAVVETARSGVYREYSVRNMPKHYLAKYFSQTDGRFIVRDDVRRLVRFENMNLFDKQRMRTMSGFDIVFCCNVLIYFDTKSKIQVVSQLYDSLNRGGYLFVGYAESLHGLSTAFELVNFPKTVAYKKG